MHVAADHHGVHDRKNLGALVVFHLGGAVVGIEPHDVGVAAERLRHAGADDRLQLAVLQHLAERLAGLVGADRQLLGGRQDGRIAVRLGAVDVALDPFVLGEVDAVLVAQQPADEDRGGHGVDRHADALAFEVLRRLDVLLVDEDEAVPEHARGEHRNGDERALPGDEARDVFGAGEFRGVEFQSRRHAVENVARVVVDQEVEIDALDLHLAGVERQHAVVEPAGESQGQLGHRSSVARGSALVAGITTFGADPAKGAGDAALRLAARAAHANIEPSRRHRLPERRKRHERP